jgi:predicted Ser/Thr protein kinase/tetratricopeptide (TPR) repeat protein
MSALLDRLRTVLAPEYDVERELGSGGMGVVFLGRDTRLDRPVAIKVIRPELASANGAERFLREAHVLANLNHPNIVPVFDVGPRAGLFYYIMPYLDGATLAEVLARGPLPLAQAVQTGRDLLDALQSCHRRGVVHRDIKPSNILLVDGRAVLIDFGIAKSTSDPSAPPLTGPGQPVGTVEYMPPEQAAGRDATPQTDLCALAMSLYEAIAGRPWTDLASWAGVPRNVTRALQRALRPDPRARWADAAAFRRALGGVPRPGSYAWPIAGASLAVVAAVVFCRPLGLCAPTPPSESPPYELMVGGFQVVAGVADPGLARHLAFLVSDLLERLPRIRLVPTSYALRRVEDSLAGRPLSPLRVVARVAGVVAQRGKTLDVSLEVRDSLGRRLQSGGVSGRVGGEVELADAIASWVIGRLRPDLAREFVHDSTLRGRSVAALGEFLKGEDEFAEDAWSEAERHFRAALQLDPTFARAAWQLANTQRWRRVPSSVNLRDVVRRNGRYLKPLDSLLIEAELLPTGAARYRAYERALARDDAMNDPHARLLYGAELMHRGPLAGVPLDSGAAVLEESVAQNPSLAPAHDQLVWALIRLGRRDAARHALDRLLQVRRPAVRPEIDIGAVMEVAFTARFKPESLPLLLGRMPSGTSGDLAQRLRFGLGFDVPAIQLALGQQAAATASGQEAQALALVALGRLADALARFDSAAALFGTPTARLEALEWRVLPGALGMPGVPPAEVERARAALAVLRGPLASRAAWALAVDAYARGDLPTARASRGTGLRRLDVLLSALDTAARGHPRAALALTETLLPTEESEQVGDPFARAVLHVRRAQWLEGSGRRDAAEREWLWYENSDFEGWLTGEVEAAEIDWAFGTWARLQRARNALAAGDPARGCGYLDRVLELWRGADPAFGPEVAKARALRETCPR